MGSVGAMSAPRRHRPQAQARRDALLRAAVEVAAERGAAGTTHRAVTERAGLPLATVSYFFASIDELVAEALRTFVADEAARLEALADQLGGDDHSPEDMAAALSEAAMPDGPLPWALAQFESYLQAARDPALRQPVADALAVYEQVAEVALARRGRTRRRGSGGGAGVQRPRRRLLPAPPRPPAGGRRRRAAPGAPTAVPRPAGRPGRGRAGGSPGRRRRPDEIGQLTPGAPGASGARAGVRPAGGTGPASRVGATPGPDRRRARRPWVQSLRGGTDRHRHALRQAASGRARSSSPYGATTGSDRRRPRQPRQAVSRIEATTAPGRAPSPRPRVAVSRFGATTGPDGRRAPRPWVAESLRRGTDRRRHGVRRAAPPG